MSRKRLFDAAVEAPDLIAADRRARAARRSGGARARAGRRADQVPTSPMIDPRIAARRAQVAADEAAAPRRGRRLALATIALVVAASAGGLVLLSPLAGVRTVEVGGAHRTGAAAVRAASGLQAAPPLVRVDEARVAARIGALPWVGRVRVERRWPRTVVIAVEERLPAAVAPCQGTGGECLVDSTGRVLAGAAADARAAAVLPRIAGVPPAGGPGSVVPHEARGALAVAVALPEALRPLVGRVRGDGPEVALDLRAAGREESPPVVRLGSAERIPDKLTAAATVLARISVNGVGTLDVRVPESPAVTRARAAPQSGQARARAAPQSGQARARAAPQSGQARARAAPQSGQARARAAPQSGQTTGSTAP